MLVNLNLRLNGDVSTIDEYTIDWSGKIIKIEEISWDHNPEHKELNNPAAQAYKSLFNTHTAEERQGLIAQLDSKYAALAFRNIKKLTPEEKEVLKAKTEEAK